MMDHNFQMRLGDHISAQRPHSLLKRTSFHHNTAIQLEANMLSKFSKHAQLPQMAKMMVVPSIRCKSKATAPLVASLHL